MASLAAQAPASTVQLAGYGIKWGVWNYRARRKTQVRRRSCCAIDHYCMLFMWLSPAHPSELLARSPECCSSRDPSRASAHGARLQCAARRWMRGAAASAACCWAAGPLSSPRTAGAAAHGAFSEIPGAGSFVPLCGICIGANVCIRYHIDPSYRYLLITAI